MYIPENLGNLSQEGIGLNIISLCLRRVGAMKIQKFVSTRSYLTSFNDLNDIMT